MLNDKWAAGGYCALLYIAYEVSILKYGIMRAARNKIMGKGAGGFWRSIRDLPAGLLNELDRDSTTGNVEEHRTQEDGIIRT